MNLTIFDLDNTLLAGDSDYAWGQFLVQKGIVDVDHYTRENDRFYEDYKRKTLDIHEYQRFVLAPLLDMSETEKQQLHQEFMLESINPLRLKKADKLIKDHEGAGDQLLIITATNSFIAGPIGPLLGIDTVLATEPEVVDGRFTGKIDGTPCFQGGKITRLQQWLREQQITPAQVTFYSDSINDLPLLEYADSPIVVDPDDSLRAHAQSVGWPVISLR
ncbi:MAG: HAD family hydrolase [Cellvibrionaceae bacterium]